MQLVCPVHAWYWPRAQIRHVSELDGWKVPTAQLWHSLEPTAAKVPPAHAVQVAALYVAERVPCGQSAHALEAAALNRPGEHAGVGDAVGTAVGAVVGKAVGAAVGAWVGVALGLGVGDGVGTATHCVQPCSPAVQLPSGHAWQMWYSCLSWYLPASQCRQFVPPVHAPNRPAWQALHEPAELGWNFPSGQLPHAADPATAYVPLSQPVQLAAL
jgi:hypothetical protein